MDIDTTGCVLSPVYASNVNTFDLECLSGIIRFELVKIVKM